MPSDARPTGHDRDMRVLVVVAAASVLTVGVSLIDRVAVGLAERKASQYLATPLGEGVRIRVHGSSFLAQVVRGRYSYVELRSTGLQVGALAGTTLHAHLVNTALPLRALLGRRMTELAIEHLRGDLVIPYPELARASRIRGLGFRYLDGRLITTAALPVPGISEFARLSGEAVMTISEAGGVLLRVRNVSVAGRAVPRMILNQIVPTLAFPIPLPPLPYGVRLDRLTPTEDGLRVSGSARAVVFRDQPDLAK